MNPYRVVSENELIKHLKKLGYQPTSEKTNTSTFWKSDHTGKVIQVPFPYEGMYPDVILHDLVATIGKVRPTMQ